MVDRAGTRRRPIAPPLGRECDQYVASAARGDRAALESLASCMRDPVMRYCRARIGRADGTFHSADDLAQDVCIAVLGALPRYRNEGRPFLAFVYGIALRKVIDAHRAAGRDRSDAVAEVPERPDQAEGPERIVLRHETAGQVGRLLDCLSDRQRDIVILRVVHGLSAAQTATIVGSTPGAVRLAQHRALARVRQHHRDVTERSRPARADRAGGPVAHAPTADQPVCRGSSPGRARAGARLR